MNDQPAAPQWDELYDDRDQHRERIFRGVRGWIRKKSWPRLTMCLLFLVTAGPCVGMAWWIAAYRGSNLYGPPQAAGLVFAWPLFMLLARWRAGIEARRIDFSADWRGFMEHDNAAVSGEVRGILADSEMSETTQSAVRAGLGETRGGGIIVLLFLAVCTLGIWLIWNLVLSGATLLAGIVLDAELSERHPLLVRRITTEEWYKEAAAITGFHFFGLAFAALVIGWFVGIFFQFHK